MNSPHYSVNPSLYFSPQTEPPHVSTVNSPNYSVNPSLYFMPSPYYPTYPPPHNPYSPSDDGHPFRVHFVIGNISVCHGCKGWYRKDLGPPHDLCIQHEEWRTYTAPGLDSPQTKFSNVYYHANVSCIMAVWPSFLPTSLLVPPAIQGSLKREHKDHLHSHFGVVVD